MKSSLRCLALLALILAACGRETRELRSLPTEASRIAPVRVGTLQPGQPQPPGRFKLPEENNAFAINEGKRLFEWYNCAGCHAHGGGGMGPPLMDDEWIYGFQPQNIYDTIVEGRPNGMPSFGGHIPTEEVWKIVVYVRSLGQLMPKSASPGRSDNLYPGESEMKREGQEEARRAPAEHGS
jgi:cytochrome c oxidase cbb3-type subunit 3